MKFLAENNRIDGPGAVTVGMFDGLHLGHRALIERLKENAEGLKTLIFTFGVGDETRSIYTTDEKKALLCETGVDYAFLQQFTPAFSKTDREDFILLLKDQYNMKVMAAGEDFRFGKGALGDAEYLKKNAGRLGIKTVIVPPVFMEGEKVSSTRIRALIAEGDVKRAGRMLGGYYFAEGRVQAGKQIGSLIEFPTVNIRTPKLKPRNGVYATLTRIGEQTYGSVTNVGVRPTVSSAGEVNIETNIFDFTCEIYEEKVSVYFVERIRDEKKFLSLEALKKQIAQDKKKAIALLAIKTFTNPGEYDII
jgi:riboflavin kinase/FMN adenylyltransferase